MRNVGTVIEISAAKTPMPFKHPIIYSCMIVLLIASCSRKHIPESPNTEATPAKADSVKVKRAMVKRTATPKVIVVNDKVAKKSTDGRLYYDLDGHRYWKNYDDGKYYLFNQSMYSNKAFKPH